MKAEPSAARNSSKLGVEVQGFPAGAQWEPVSAINAVPERGARVIVASAFTPAITGAMKNGEKTRLTAPQRLRALADALEGDESLTDIAARFRVPLRVLQRVITPKTRHYRPATAITMEQLEEAAGLVGQGKTFEQAAAILRVPVSTLTATMLRHGLSAKTLRPPVSQAEENIQLAIEDYRRGLKVPQICRDRKVPERTLYSHLRKQGVRLRQIRRK
jgi:hypothetical protein